MPARTFRILSLGCKVNQVEGEALAERLREMGLVEAPPAAEPDLAVVNTCAVTAEAARQSRQAVRRALRAGSRVAVTGCCAHPAAADAALRQIPGLLCAGPDKAAILEQVRALWPDLGPPAAGDLEAAVCPDRSRALLKVQDGCAAACAYCVVRLVRPVPRSTPPQVVLERTRRLVEAGYREIVVCGIHLGLYGADLPPEKGVRTLFCKKGTRTLFRLAGLLGRMLEVPGLGRLRLSSLEPMEVTDELIALMASEPERLCPHLHLPLQSGDDGVLGRMNRPYTSAAYLEAVERVRRALPQPAITTDLLVGFPGETDAAFERTLAVCRQAAFSRVHVFPFSARPGTPAAAMDGQVPREVIRARRERAAAVGEDLARTYREGLVGRAAAVVIERLGADGSAEGVSERYVRVRIDGPLAPGVARRAIVRVVVSACEGETLVGRAEPAGNARKKGSDPLTT